MPPAAASSAVTRRLFLFLMSALYLAAFASFFNQSPGLVGFDGLLPGSPDSSGLLAWLCAALGLHVDAGIDLISLAGLALSLVALSGRATTVVMFSLYLLYYAVYSHGGTFLGFQWDILLLEAGLLAAWYASPFAHTSTGTGTGRGTRRSDTRSASATAGGGGVGGGDSASSSGRRGVDSGDTGGVSRGFTTSRSFNRNAGANNRNAGTNRNAGFTRSPVSPRTSSSPNAAEPSPSATWALRFLLFKLMLMSGVVKIQSNDVAWTQLTALHYHYATQCIPTPLAWYGAQLASPLLKVRGTQYDGCDGCGGYGRMERARMTVG